MIHSVVCNYVRLDLDSRTRDRVFVLVGSSASSTAHSCC
jgi:hypothetical protein